MQINIIIKKKEKKRKDSFPKRVPREKTLYDTDYENTSICRCKSRLQLVFKSHEEQYRVYCGSNAHESEYKGIRLVSSLSCCQTCNEVHFPERQNVSVRHFLDLCQLPDETTPEGRSDDVSDSGHIHN